MRIKLKALPTKRNVKSCPYFMFSQIKSYVDQSSSGNKNLLHTYVCGKQSTDKVKMIEGKSSDASDECSGETEEKLETMIVAKDRDESGKMPVDRVRSRSKLELDTIDEEQNEERSRLNLDMINVEQNEEMKIHVCESTESNQEVEEDMEELNEHVQKLINDKKAQLEAEKMNKNRLIWSENRSMPELDKKDEEQNEHTIEDFRTTTDEELTGLDPETKAYIEALKERVQKLFGDKTQLEAKELQKNRSRCLKSQRKSELNNRDGWQTEERMKTQPEAEELETNRSSCLKSQSKPKLDETGEGQIEKPMETEPAAEQEQKSLSSCHKIQSKPELDETGEGQTEKSIKKRRRSRASEELTRLSQKAKADMKEFNERVRRLCSEVETRREEELKAKTMFQSRTEPMLSKIEGRNGKLKVERCRSTTDEELERQAEADMQEFKERVRSLLVEEKQQPAKPRDHLLRRNRELLYKLCKSDWRSQSSRVEGPEHHHPRDKLVGYIQEGCIEAVRLSSELEDLINSFCTDIENVRVKSVKSRPDLFLKQSLATKATELAVVDAFINSCKTVLIQELLFDRMELAGITPYSDLSRHSIK